MKIKYAGWFVVTFDIHLNNNSNSNTVIIVQRSKEQLARMEKKHRFFGWNVINTFLKALKS